MAKPRVAIVTGLSGAGLSTAIHALQDNGFYCIDNLPIELLWQTLALIESGEITAKAGYAFGMDIRNDHFAARFPAIKRDLEQKCELTVLYIRAEESALEARFSTARRRHPLSGQGTDIKMQIKKEMELLTPVANAADVVIDSTHLKPKDLKDHVEAVFSAEGRPLRSLQLQVMSFGFKHAPLPVAESVHDVRFLKNPYFDPTLKEKTGLDSDVRKYVMADPSADEFLTQLKRMYRFLLPNYLAEGRHFFRLAIGCTGGHHRSVTFAEMLARDLRDNPIPGIIVSVIHRDIEH
jgi:UPF0042 nucleotide-binding protein